MKKVFKISRIIAAVAVMFALSLTSCKKDGNEGKDDEVVKVTGIKFTKSEITIAVNKTTTLEYTITPSNATNKEVTFTSDKESVAKVEASGEVKGISEGTAKITVTTKDGGFKATCNVTVNKGGSGEGEQKILVETITIEPSTKELNVEETFQLEATVLPVDAADKTLTWSSSSDNVTVDLSGKITAVKEGTATITATAKDGSEAKATCEVTVKKKNYKESYTISDYYQWDAYESYDKEDTYKWEENSSCFNDGKDVMASQSCKDCVTADQMRMYLGAGVYWDEEGLEYTLPDGNTYKTGWWVKKSSKIEGFKDNTADKKDEVDLGDGTNLFQVGKPKNTSEYFFLPANGYYPGDSSTGNLMAPGQYGNYWSRTSGGEYSYYLDLAKDRVYVLNGTRNDGIFRLFAE